MNIERKNDKNEILCSTCNIYKSEMHFKCLKNQWYICVDCNNLRRRNIYKNDPERHKNYHKKYYENNKEKCVERAKKYRQKFPEKIKEAHKKYSLKNPQRKIIRRKLDIEYRVKENLRTRIYYAIKGTVKKSDKTMNLIGCDFSKLKQYLEEKFTENMSWDNYGKWHIDHIKPCVLFDLTIEEEQRRCFHYTNLQPLWAKDNLQKNTKYEEYKISTDI